MVRHCLSWVHNPVLDRVLSISRKLRRGRRWTFNWLIVSALLPLILFLAASWYDKTVTMARARDNMEATSHALAAHAQAVMQAASLALTLQLDRVQDMDWRQIGGSQPIHDFLRWLVSEMPQLDSAFYVDRDGYNSASSRAFPMRPFDDRERDYFQRASAGATGLVVSGLFSGKLEGDISFVVGRARMADGQFDGMAALTVSPQWFRAFYERVLLWRPGASTALLRNDGVVLVHFPRAAFAGLQLPPDSGLMRALRRGETSGIIIEPICQGGRLRLVSFRAVPDTDLVTVYALLQSTILAPWYQHVALFAVFALLSSAALLLVGYRSLAQAERERANLATLLAETERRQRAEAALQHAGKMEALGRLTGGVAHDFNNLLAAILGSLELASRRVQDPRAQRSLEIARQAGQRGARLVAQMLAFARNHPVAPGPVDLRRLVLDLEPLIRRTCEPGIEVQFDLQPDVGTVLADPVQLELALLNLVVNARDAMTDGGTVTVTATRVGANEPLPPGLAPGGYARIITADTGPGMPAEVRERAFEPFFTTKPLGKGTGLGLSMVHGLAHQLGGTALIDSAPGQGTRVTIYLRQTDAAQQPASASAATFAQPRYRILLVDDDASVRASAAGMLAALGHEVTEAEGGAQAMDTIRAGAPFDLLIADVAMPGMTGQELASEVQRARAGMPVLLISGFVAAHQAQVWPGNGWAFLPKPFDLTALGASIRQAMGRDSRPGEGHAVHAEGR